MVCRVALSITALAGASIASGCAEPHRGQSAGALVTVTRHQLLSDQAWAVDVPPGWTPDERAPFFHIALDSEEASILHVAETSWSDPETTTAGALIHDWYIELPASISPGDRFTVPGQARVALSSYRQSSILRLSEGEHASITGEVGIVDLGADWIVVELHLAAEAASSFRLDRLQGRFTFTDDKIEIRRREKAG